MSSHVFVVFEWLPKAGKDQEVWDHFKKLMALTKEKEKRCISAHATRQIKHPGSPGVSKYKKLGTITLQDQHLSPIVSSAGAFEFPYIARMRITIFLNRCDY